MKSNTKQVRDAVKNLIIEKGANNILNRHMYMLRRAERNELFQILTATGKIQRVLLLKGSTSNKGQEERKWKKKDI